MFTEKKGILFNIQRYSLHDGPGIRTIVFLKGCPLRCKWCSNPESQRLQPELSFNPSLCIGCLRCISKCRANAFTLSERGPAVDRVKCVNCLDCTKACAAGALSAQGREVTVDEIMPELLRDRSYYIQSGGGVTLSGGEPLMQPEFTCAMLKALKAQGIHTAVETTGCAQWDVLKSALDYTDVLLYDLKQIDNKKHCEGTGTGNSLILDNLKKAALSGKKLIVRIPLIPGFNTDDDTIAQFIAFIRSIGSPPVGLLAFHQLGSNKYVFLDKKYPYQGRPQMQAEQAEEIRKKFEAAGLNVTVGG